MRKARQGKGTVRSLMALSVVALFTVPALAQWLGPERAHPAAKLIMAEDFVAESGMTSTCGATASVATRDFVAPAP